VIRLLRHYVQPDTIDAIDLNPVHLQIARRYFDVTTSLANLIHADGISWLQNYTGPRYDMIIDDMFGEEDGEPARAADLDYRWLGIIKEHLSSEGVIVLNTLSARMLKQAACLPMRNLQKTSAAHISYHCPFTIMPLVRYSDNPFMPGICTGDCHNTRRSDSSIFDYDDLCKSMVTR
jgi:spermidine synthase